MPGPPLDATLGSDSLGEADFTKIFSNNHYKNALNIYKNNAIQNSISNTNLNYGFYISY